MRDKIIEQTKKYLRGKEAYYATNVEAIIEDPTGLVSPSDLLVQNLKEVAHFQALLDTLAGFEDE